VIKNREVLEDVEAVLEKIGENINN